MLKLTFQRIQTPKCEPKFQIHYLQFISQTSTTRLGHKARDFNNSNRLNRSTCPISTKFTLKSTKRHKQELQIPKGLKLNLSSQDANFQFFFPQILENQTERHLKKNTNSKFERKMKREIEEYRRRSLKRKPFERERDYLILVKVLFFSKQIDASRRQLYTESRLVAVGNLMPCLGKLVGTWRDISG